MANYYFIIEEYEKAFEFYKQIDKNNIINIIRLPLFRKFYGELLEMYRN
ncbi:hypothetical protein AB2063_000839 [Clostridium botulinum]